MRFKLRFWNLLLASVLVVTAFMGSQSPLQTVQAETADLFISEYIEGSSSNKAIEIYNGTGATVDLAAGVYTLELYSNGSPIVSQTIALTGIIADGDVYVLANSLADPAILAVADITNNSVINFNGDDAVVLRKNGAVIDAFGQIGVDPGSEWTGGGQDDTLRRKVTVCEGDTNPDDAFDAAVEWDTFAINTFDGLGSHTSDCNSGGTCGSVFFSEYIEGSSSNKALEIYNGTGGDVDLSEYSVELYSNGSTSVTNTLTLSGTLTDGDVYIIANSSANAAILAIADVTSTVTYYNGDDALLLKHNGVVIDSIGKLGEDPGTNWSGDGVSTLDQTLRRKVSISSGDIIPDDTFDPSVEWDSFAIDTFDGLGSHTATCGPVLPNLPIIPTCPSGIITFPGTAISDNFSAIDEDGTVVDASITGGGAIGISITNLVAATEVGGELTGTLDVADTTASGPYDVEVTFSNDDDPDAQTAICTVPVTVIPETCPLTDTNQIGEVQGETDTSPLVNTSVTVSGVVVADFQDTLSGYYVQDLDGDGNANTSDGIFVYNSSYPVSVGDPVQLTASVSEYNGLTELTSVSQFSICGLEQVITPTTISLPVTDPGDFEKYESMLVTFPQDLVISEYYNFGQYGEIVLTSERFLTPTAEFEPGPDSITAADNFALNKITLDDGRSSRNPDPAIHPNGEVFDMTNLFRGGDLVTNVTGALDYKFGLWRIQPTQGADYTNTNVRAVTPSDVGGNIKVASFNVLNYFSTLDDGVNDICGPAEDMECRGADTEAEFTRQRDKIIAAISDIDADVVGLMEIENNLYDEAVIDLVAGLNVAMGADTYNYVNTGAIGTDAIKVALIYKPATINLIGSYAVLDSSVDSRFLDDKNRPTLAQTFQDAVNGGYVTVAVNHLKSKGSDCNDVGDPDLGDGAGNCNLTRKAAAEAMVDWLATDPTGSGDGDFLIIGDLNSYDKEDPIDAILSGPDDVLGTYDDYTDMIFDMIGEDAYSYVFDGQTGYLDHALANATLKPQITGVDIWHINADEPSLIDYDMSYKADAQDLLYAPDAYRSSDHDPVIIGLDLTPFSMSPVEITEAVEPGDQVKIPITISNHGFASDTYDIIRLPDSLSISIGFPTVVGPVAPGASATFDATVTVSENEARGNTKVYELQATSRTHSLSLTSTINILVDYLHVYFPLIFK